MNLKHAHHHQEDERASPGVLPLPPPTTTAPLSGTTSSSSSQYSSATSTPTLAQIAEVLPTNTTSMENNAKEDGDNGGGGEPSPESSQRPPTNDSSTTDHYRHLMQRTKIQMSNKFQQLENETGLNLETIVIPPPPTPQPLNNNNDNGDHHPKTGIATETNKNLALMKDEIRMLKQELDSKNEIVAKMYKIRSQVDSELEDLTVSLFEEANKMVYNANILRDKAEKELYEATLKIDMLTAEVQALKLLVITSTPSRPNAHLHPQLGSPTSNKTSNGNKKNPTRRMAATATGTIANNAAVKLPVKSPSNYELGDIEPDSKEDYHQDGYPYDDEDEYLAVSAAAGAGNNEIDPVFYDEFTEWRKHPTLEPIRSDFMKRIYDEEIYPVLNFKNKRLTAMVIRSIEDNTLMVETINSDRLMPFPKKCALLEMSRVCRYRMKMAAGGKPDGANNHQQDNEQWYYISTLCRNRIATVCDLFCYLRYVKDGLVKSAPRDIYWTIQQRRRNIALAKLGFPPIP